MLLMTVTLLPMSFDKISQISVRGPGGMAPAAIPIASLELRLTPTRNVNRSPGKVPVNTHSANGMLDQVCST